jgi:hypothetical protein
MKVEKINLIHQPYQQKFGHREDFRVRYRFYSLEEGGERCCHIKGFVLIFGMNIGTMLRIKSI